MESFFIDCSAIIGSERNIFLALFIAGLASGFTHCAAMCGPFVVMQTSENMIADCYSPVNEFTRLKKASLLPYHLGRITTYIILGSVAAYLSAHILAFDNMRWLSTLLLAISGITFITYALASVIGVKSFNPLKSLPFSSNIGVPSFIEDKAKPFFINPRGLNGYVLGFILGFIPCGMIVSVIFSVSALGNVIMAVFAMALFGVGTIFGLIAVAYGSDFFLSNYFLTAKKKLLFKIVKSSAIFISGLILLITSYNIIY